MSRNTKLFALIGAVVLVASVFAPAVSAGAATANTAGNADLGVDVTQDGDDVSVSVTKNDTGVEGANVTVEPVGGNATYEDAGNYTTDDEGVVELSAPEENVTVEVTAAYGDETASTTVDLVNETLAEEEETDAFGQEVSAYLEQLLSGNETNIGPMISSFVTENNPGADNRPDHAGPPEDRGPDRDDDGNETDDDERGPPEDRGPDRDDDERGPPEDRGPDRDDDEEDSEEADEEDEATESEEDEDEEDDGDEEDDDDEDDDDRGNGNNGNGNGNGR